LPLLVVGSFAAEVWDARARGGSPTWVGAYGFFWWWRLCWGALARRMCKDGTLQRLASATASDNFSRFDESERGRMMSDASEADAAGGPEVALPELRLFRVRCVRYRYEAIAV